MAQLLREGIVMKEITKEELKQAMRTCTIVAVEEAFPSPSQEIQRCNVNPYIDPADGVMKVTLDTLDILSFLPQTIASLRLS